MLAEAQANFKGKGINCVGNLMSQYFTNLYLDELDHFVKRIFFEYGIQ
jgi:hypothetical protein